MKKIVILFIIIFVVFAVIIFFQLNNKSINNFFSSSVTSRVTINSSTFRVELAKTTEEQIRGLSGRKSLAKDSGMLFVFDRPSYYTFWMRDMEFPLDIIFIRNDEVVGVFENLPPASAKEDNPPQYGSSIISDKVLEINAGLARENNIEIGDAVIVEIK